MNNSALILAVVGFVFTFTSLVLYLRTIPQNRVPTSVFGFASRMAIGAAISGVAIYLGITGVGAAGWMVYVPAGLGLVVGAMILVFLTQRKTPLGDIKIKVGEPYIPFSAKTPEGEDYSSDAFKGKRILFKLFRGGWCPYCSQELIIFNEMIDEMAEYDVSLVALSKDEPDQAVVHRNRDDLTFQLLSDAELKVVRSYGVEHHKTLGQSSVAKSKLGGIFGGVVFGLAPFKVMSMAIPTSVLIDEEGIVRWIDQSEDIRLRSSREMVMGAIKSAFGEIAAAA